MNVYHIISYHIMRLSLHIIISFFLPSVRPEGARGKKGRSFLNPPLSAVLVFWKKRESGGVDR